MEPTAQTPYVPSAPPLSQRLREIILERRLPNRIQGLADKLAFFVGRNERTLRRLGYRFRVRRQTSDEWFVENICVRHEYNPPGFEIRPGDTVVDIGGNMGTFAVFAAKQGARVVSIEPNAENFRLLQENARLNRVDVACVRAAITDFDGSITLHCTPHGGYHSILNGRGGTISEEVPAMRFERIFSEHGIDRCHFLKCDCEGAEYQIFATLPDSVLSRIDKVAMEWHGGDDRNERIAQANQLIGRLRASGFRIESFTEHVGFTCGALFAKR